MDNKTKRDIDERVRVPYDPKTHDRQMSLDAKASSMTQLNTQRKMEQLVSL